MWPTIKKLLVLGLEVSYKIKACKENANPKFTVHVKHDLQLQSRGTTFILLLKVSNDWDSLISFGRTSHNFGPTNLTVSMPYRFVLALGKTRLVLPRRLHVTTLATNTSAMKDRFTFSMVL